jgi:outer membrane protein OmpA-like peptidoglycan-associated protein
VFSRDWERMYFSQNNIIDGIERPGRDQVLHLKVFEARRGRMDWMNKRELPFNSDQYSCMHPTLSADDQTLYFASDMPGGLGGFDLYKSVLRDGVWGTPTNLGPQINTDLNDVFPFIYPSGDLYFASAGHSGLGGYDLFRINLNRKESLVNLGEPFNTPSDDFGIILSDDGTRGFFTSNRPGGYGRDDIYSFVVETAMPGMERIEAKQKTIVVLGADGQPVQGAGIRVLAMQDGAFMSAGKELYRSRIEPMDSTSNEIKIRLIKLEAEELGAPDNYTNAIGEANFDFKPYTEYYIIANTADLTADARYRIKADEAEGKIVIKLNKPSVKVLSGKLLNASGHQISNANLRFTNIATSEQDKGRTDDQGNFAIALPKGEYNVKIGKEGFKEDYLYLEYDPAFSTFREYRLDHNAQPADKLPITEAIKPGYHVTIDKIEYELNSDRLDRKAQITLLNLADLLKEHQTMEIEVFSHTDSHGTDKSNLELSQRRADKVKEFIIESSKRTIAPTRISAVGRGESMLKNHCKDGINCADTEHAINRRTEIVVKKI